MQNQRPPLSLTLRASSDRKPTPRSLARRAPFRGKLGRAIALETENKTRSQIQNQPDEASVRRVLFAALIMLVLAFRPMAANGTEPIELRLRFAWGEGAPRQWEGELAVEGGIFSDLVDLGLSADSPGSKFVQESRVVLRAPGPTSQDGLDVTVRGSADARLLFALRPEDPRVSATRVETTLGALISGSENRSLDSQGNQLSIRRVPGDRLRVSFRRDSLVFAPQDLFTFSVAPHLLELEPNANLRVHVQLFAARSDRELWSHQESLRADPAGGVPRQKLAPVPLPLDEGVYDIALSLYRRPRIGVPIWRAPPVAQRRLQVVVIDPNRPAPNAEEWRDELTIDPANPRWGTWTARWQSLVRLPGLDLVRLPGFDQTKPLASSPPQETTHLGQKMLQLAPDEWQAYPIPITSADRPHLLEIEYPSHLPQTLGISIIEPDESGEVTPLCVDSGIHVPAPPSDAEPAIERHRIVFWPRTKAPVILLTNLRPSGSSVFGRIRVSSGPSTLAPAPLDVPFASGRPQRLLAAYFDKPLFTANFSAREVFDPSGQQITTEGLSLDDWKKFHDGGLRLIEYLKYAGYNGAVICVARDGSTIYPSDVLPSSPRFDSGTFLGTGQDAIRKDVLEMLFRMFDRDGLQLVPAVHFSGRVAALERIRRQDDASSVGLGLTDARGRVAATQYNPLDPRVQGVVHAAITELASRYGNHASYGGIALQIGADSYLSFPDTLWGLDQPTFDRFVEATGLPAQLASEADSPAKRAVLLESAERQHAWLEWRATELGRLMADLQRITSEPRGDAKLYLATHDLLEGTVPQRLLQPTPSSSTRIPLADVMLRLGIDARLYRHNAHMVFLRPQRLAPGRTLNEQAVDIHLATSSDADTYFAGDEPGERMAEETGSLFFHERVSRRIPSFDAVSPFGPERTNTQLLAHATPAGLYNRKRFAQSLALMDSQTFLDGGWLLPLGQEDVLLPLIETYRLLPRGRFHLVTPRSEGRTQPIVVRQRSESEASYFYLVNDSPWSTNVSLEIDCRDDTKLTTLGQRIFPEPQDRNGGMQWRISLAPYDVVAARLSDESAVVANWQTQLAPQVLIDLERKIREVGIRANAALERPSLDLLPNGDFEQEAVPENRIPGWQFVPSENTSIQLDSEDKYKGRHALRMTSEGPVLWVRSTPFDPPETGRLYVLVRLKVKDARQQPRLRVALDNEKGFYWPLPVGADSKRTRLPATWSEDFLFPFEQLPMSELEQIQLGFDLMGEGEVWIDDIQMFDVWMQREDRNALLMASGLASKSLERYAKVAYCQRFLESFWPQFLMEHVAPDTNSPAARTAISPAAATNAPTLRNDDPPSESTDPKSRTAMERFFDFMPKVPSFPTPFWR